MLSENRFTRFATVALIGLFVSFMFANSVFIHSHKLADGSLVCHSHPFNPSGAHSHSGNALTLIAAFNGAASSFTGVAMAFAASVVLACALILSLPTLYHKQNWCASRGLRAPPVKM